MRLQGGAPVKHLDRKYFSYRAQPVAAAQARYPQRAAILRASELLRLGFMLVGSLLCAAIFGILAIGAAGRVGWTDWRSITFVLLTVLPIFIVARTARGLVQALKAGK